MLDYVFDKSNNKYYIGIGVDIGCNNFSYNMINLMLRRLYKVYIDKLDFVKQPIKEKSGTFGFCQLYFENEEDAKTYVDIVNSIIIANKIEGVCE